MPVEVKRALLDAVIRQGKALPILIGLSNLTQTL